MWMHNVWAGCHGVHVDYGRKGPKTISAGANPEARLERADLEPARIAPPPRARESERHTGDSVARHGRTQIGKDHFLLQAFDESRHRAFASAAPRTRAA